MAVGLVGYTQGTFAANGQHSVTLPAGTAAGHLGVWVVAPGSDKKPATRMPAGWLMKGSKSDGTSLWVKTFTAADIAAPLVIGSRIELGVVLSGASGVRSIGSGESLKVSQNGGGLLLFGWAATDNDLTSGKIHAADVVNESFTYKGKHRKYNAWWSPMVTAGNAYIDTNAGAFFAVEIVPRVTPYAPTILSPADGLMIDYDGSIPFGWRHNSVSGDPSTQTKFRLHVRPAAGGTDLYAVSSGGWWLTDFANVNGSMQEWVVPASSLTDWTDYLWWIQTNETGSTDLSPAAQGSFSLRPKPSTTVTATASGTVVTVVWHPTVISGAEIAWYRFRVTSAAAAAPDQAQLYDSGMIAVDPTVGLPADSSGDQTSYIGGQSARWVNGATYKVWVDFGQTNGQQTIPAASNSVTVSWLPPAGPTSVVCNTAARPITITANGLSGYETLKVEFSVSGKQHTIAAPITSGSMTLDLPLAPYGVLVSYQVSASQVVSGVELWSDPVEAIAMGLDASCYLVADDLLSWMRVVLQADQPHEMAQTNTVAYGLPRPDDEQNLPFVDLGPEQGWTGTTTLKSVTMAGRDALLAFWRANDVFVTRWPPEREGNALSDAGSTRMAKVTGTRDERLAQVLLARHLFQFSWVEQ